MLTVKYVKNSQGRKVKIDADEFFVWLEDLRSGKYKQAMGQLQINDKYCCLGVACKGLIQRSDLIYVTDDDTDRKRKNIIYGDLPEQQPSSSKWLQYINSDFERRFNISLIDMNDESAPLYIYNSGSRKRKATFKVIADMLEAVYIGGYKYSSPKEDTYYHRDFF